MLGIALATGCYSGLGWDPDAAGPGAASAEGGSGDDDGGSDGDDGGDTGDRDGLECEPGVLPSVAPMRRLTRRQYETTILDLTAWILDEAQATQIVDELAVKISVLPEDDGTDFRRMDQTLSQEHIDGWYRVGQGLGAALTETPARLEALAGSCATDAEPGNDAACVRDLVARFGRRAFRRPLTDEELDFYVADAAGSADDVSPASFAERISVLLMVPDFVYLIEDDLPESETDVFPLSAFEKASRLSYHFWQSMPDEALLAAAEAGELDTEEGWAAQVDRVLEDPRTRRTLDQFTAEWLRLERLPQLDLLLGTPAYDAFVGDQIPSPDLRDDMIAEVQDLFAHYVFEDDGDLDDVLLSTLSFARSAELAAIYGVEPWQDGQPPPELPADRGGLVTRAALVATGSVVTHPVLKGKLVRTRILCDELPPPPADIPPPPQLDPVSTIREQLEELTEREGTACLGCHALLNPLGYVTEGYDGLGRSRTSEQVFDTSTGALLAELPVDTATTPRVAPGDERVASSGMDLSQYIVESGRADECLSRQYFRFAHGRVDDPQADRCAVLSLQSTLEESGSLREMLRAIALQPEFLWRYRGQDDGGAGQ